MKTHLAIIVLGLAAVVTFAQSPNWDGRRGGSNIEFPRHERSSSSGNDSRRSNDSDRYDTYAIPEPPSPLPGLTNQYRSVRGWFRSDVFPDAPSWVEPTNLSELLRALVYLKDFADGKLRNLRSGTSELEDRYRSLQTQIARNGDVGASLQLEAAAIETDLDRSQRETREAEEKLASQNSLLNQLTEITKQISAEVASTKDDMFAALYDAARRGQLLSPGNYRPLPKPLQPIYAQSGAQAQATPITPMLAQPLFPAAPHAAAEAIRAVPIFAPLRAQAIRNSPVNEGEVQEKLNQINSSLPLINQAYEALNQASRRVRGLEQSASVSEVLVQQARERLESLRSQNTSAESALSSVRARLNDAGAAVQRQKEKFPVQCLEYAVVKYYSKKVKEMVVENFPDVETVKGAVDTRNLGVFMKVMSHVVELGADTLKVIERVPGALADNVEDPAELQTALNEAVSRFKLNLFTDMSGLPKPIAKYYQKSFAP
jgi:predicted  nucleic acid-binding Zn-ribbon protein